MTRRGLVLAALRRNMTWKGDDGETRIGRTQDQVTELTMAEDGTELISVRRLSAVENGAGMSRGKLERLCAFYGVQPVLVQAVDYLRLDDVLSLFPEMPPHVQKAVQEAFEAEILD
jgi:hypothetical protein